MLLIIPVLPYIIKALESYSVTNDIELENYIMLLSI